MQKTAVISDCGKYRYLLRRVWGDGKTCVFVMLNPSTADDKVDDPTIRRCINFAKREGCGSLTVLNLYALRTKDPKVLKARGYPVGERNDNMFGVYAANAVGQPSLVIAAWGAHARTWRVGQVMKMFHDADVPVYALGLTKDGSPRHPLYMASDTPLIPFNQMAVVESEKGRK